MFITQEIKQIFIFICEITPDFAGTNQAIFFKNLEQNLRLDDI